MDDEGEASISIKIETTPNSFLPDGTTERSADTQCIGFIARCAGPRVQWMFGNRA
jgi:hypothetical protein